MATDVDQSCYRWTREELDDQDDSREISISQMLDHGSISFGKFALEPLSWEKRSVFTRNRYQEELEKFKAPGLVAQKKAYFEEYYKRIRAMKALQENIQSETASNCADSCSISGQIRNVQRVLPSKCDGDEMISIIGPGVENSQNLKQLQFLDQNSCDHESITQCIEDHKQHDFISQYNEEIPKKTEKYVPNDSFYSSGSPEVLKDMLNADQKKVNHAIKGFKGNTFSSEVMEHSSTAGDRVKSELKAKSVTVMTQVLRDSSQKRNCKNSVSMVPQKQTVDRILSSKHTTVSSHGSNKGMHSKVTTHHPFVFATGKQAVASFSASARYDTKKILSSSPLPPMNVNSKGVSSRQGTPYCQKREKLENRTPPLVAYRQVTHLKEVSASNVIRPLKARSVNLPTSCKGDSNVGNNSNRNTRNNEDGKRKLIEVANDETCLKEVGAHGKSTIFHVLSGNQNHDNIKMAPSRTRDLSVSTKFSHLGDNSLDRRKPKPEKPRWR